MEIRIKTMSYFFAYFKSEFPVAERKKAMKET